MNDPDSESDALVQLAGEFSERHRRGERPSPAEYAEKHPDLAGRIRDLFPALMLIEEFGSVGGQAPGTLDGNDRPPQQLGEYRILREVARGGMGVVYEAVQESLGRHVALKVLPAAGLMSPTHLERFRREARAAARLHHTNIVPVFGVGEHEGVHYFAMQFIQGQSLDRVLHEMGMARGPHGPKLSGDGRRGSDLSTRIADGLLTEAFPERGEGGADRTEARPRPANGSHVPTKETRRGPTSVVLDARTEHGARSDAAYSRNVARIGVQVAEALAYAHQQGVLHRDIKPSNLLLDTQGTVWITDFGLAKEEGTGELTTQGDIVGTLRYMAPERFRGQADPRSDVYSLGLTLYEMLTLRPAFAASERARLIEQVLHEEPPWPRRLDVRIPRDIETIVLKAMSKDPGDRYPTAALMGADLRRFLADRPIAARRSSAREQAWRWCRRNPALAALTGAVAVLSLCLTTGLFVNGLLRVERDRALANQRRAVQAEKLALDLKREVQVGAHLAQASAHLRSTLAGRRRHALDEVAAALRHEPAPQSRHALRDLTIACLALVDLRPSETSVAVPPGTTAVAFDGSYQRYALSDEKGQIVVSRVADERPIRHLPGLGLSLSTLQLSPDGQFVAVYSSGKIQIWGVDEGRPVFPEPLPAGPAIGFSADGRRVVAALPGSSVGVFDLQNGAETRRFRTGIVPYTLAPHPDGRQVAVADRQNAVAVEVWDIDCGSKVTELGGGDGEFVWSLAWHPDGLRLALGFGSPNSQVQVWDVAQRRPLSTLKGHAQQVFEMAFQPGGDLLLTRSWDGTSRLWDAGSGRQLLNWPTFINDMHFNRGGSVCGHVLVGGRARLVEVAGGREYRTLVSSLGAGRGGYHWGDVGPSGLLAVGMDDGARLWNLATGREVAFLPVGLTHSANFVARPEGVELLTCGLGGLLRWPIRAAPELPGRLCIGPPRLIPLPDVPHSAQPSADGRVVAVSSERSGTALVVDLATQALQCILAPHPGLNRAVLSPDGRWAATSGWHTPSIRVWNAHTGAMVKELPLGDQNTVFFAPDGRALVTSRGDEYVYWEIPSWRPVRRLPWEVQSYPGWVAFSPDHTLLALELSPAVIHLIDAASGTTLAKLEDPHADRARWLGFSPDGTQLVAIATYSQAIHVWDLRLIRQRLAAIDLDWDSPPYPPAPEVSGRQHLEMEALLGEFSQSVQGSVERARRQIASYQHALEARPNSPSACNNLAWLYATGPEPLRDPSQALVLAEKAVRLMPRNTLFRNTLGVAYYRAGRYREAAETLRANLTGQMDKHLASDLYFLAMSHHQTGETALAQTYLTWAMRSTRSQVGLTVEELSEQAAFLAEAKALMGKGWTSD